MHTFDTIDRIDRLRQRIGDLKGARWLMPSTLTYCLAIRERSYLILSEMQQTLSKGKKPTALNNYEALHKINVKSHTAEKRVGNRQYFK